MTRTGWPVFAVMGLGAAAAADPKPLAESSPGRPVRLTDVVLPGPELGAAPADDRKAPLVLRVVAARPHGTAFRYDFEVTGLDPGTFDLSTALRQKAGGGPAAGLPPLPLVVTPLRPAGQAEPHPLPPTPAPPLGGYRTAVTAVGVVWGLGLLGILLSFVFPRRKTRTAKEAGPPPSLADRLRPLVERAAAGRADRAELAALERLLLAVWRRRLGLDRAEPAAAVAELRNHPEAGPLLSQLEVWLHHPEPPPPVDVAGLLKPYRDLPPDALAREAAA